MDVFSLNTIQETVHLVSMFSYMNTMSDFLFSKHFITEEEKLQLLPVAEGIYRYLESPNETPNNINKKKIILIKEIINGSDIYGGKPNEYPDPIFVNELFKRIITSMVFDKYGNIYGFILNVTRESETKDVGELIQEMKIRLNSTLPKIVFERVFNDYLLPLFPLPNHNISLTSVEFIYAQAGAMFILSGSSHDSFKEIFESKNSDTKETNKFEEYLGLAHAIEELINSNEMDKSLVQIFTLPALLYYVTENRDNDETTQNIVINPEHVTKALELLFTHLKMTITKARIAQQKDSRYQYLLLMSGYQNRTQIARNLIARNCFELKKDFEDEVIRYKNNPDEFSCLSGNLTQKLPKLNKLFEQQNRNIADKYFQYEKDTIEDLFGEEIKNQEIVEISSGLYKAFYAGPGILGAGETQQLRDSDDLLKFHYQRTGDIVYYALIRNNNTIRLIHKTDDYKFRQQLGLSKWEQFRDRDFREIKNARENFTNFINRIAGDRKEKMLSQLNTEGYDATRKEWWIDFGLNLLPFYTCVQSFTKRNLDIAPGLCTMDGLMAVNFFSEIGMVVNKFLLRSTALELAKQEIKFSTLLLRESVSQVGEKGIIDISFKLQKEMLSEIAVASVRYIDPGFGFIFSLAKSAFRSLGHLINKIGKSIKFNIVNKFLIKFVNIYSNAYTKYEKLSGKWIYYRTIDDKSFGYGYKFIKLGNNYPQLRSVTETESEIPIVMTQIKNKKSYRKINLLNEDTKQEVNLQNHFPFERSENAETKIQIISDNGFCENTRIKRSPNSFCSRLMSLINRENKQNNAITIARQKKYRLPNNIQDILFTYIFSNQKNEEAFIIDWINADKEPINWSHMKIKNPEEYYNLLYLDILDNPYLSEWEANQQISSSYGSNDRKLIELFKPINNVRDEFIQYRAYESMSFIDFYSLENYLHRGFKRIQYNTNEAILMKQAIYRLAIRQTQSTQVKVFKNLFTTEIKSLIDIENIIQNKNKFFILPNFTPTMTEVLSAMEQVNLLNDHGYVKVLYQFKMHTPYICARVKNVLKNNVEQHILLPGTKFKIGEINDYTIGDETVKLIELSYFKDVTRERKIKLIMDQLHELETNREFLNQPNEIL
ncbi:uncharacterized protein LOC127277571 [Leptopilina boulardi]|uniref:uncharacterized protein LOC127277571 n=1 Tax=Leptopilina boulardi TaxID=63433 RepID=UPI0021F59DE9|nr:uncharacterized protein LOC127277571 [Leptopilina boulardi]